MSCERHGGDDPDAGDSDGGKQKGGHSAEDGSWDSDKHCVMI